MKNVTRRVDKLFTDMRVNWKKYFEQNKRIYRGLNGLHTIFHKIFIFYGCSERSIAETGIPE